MKARRCYAHQKVLGQDGQWPVGIELRLDTMLRTTFTCAVWEAQPWHATWLLRRVLDAMGVEYGTREGLTWHQWYQAAMGTPAQHELIDPKVTRLPNPLTRQGVTLRNAVEWNRSAPLELAIRVRFNSRKAERAFWRKVQVERAADLLALAGDALTVQQLRDEALR